MKIKTYLSQRSETRSIMYRISAGFYVIEDGKKKYKTISYFTGKTIDVRQWNFKLEAPKSNNTLLKMLADGRKEVENIYNRLEEDVNLNFDSLQNALELSEKLNTLFSKDKEVIQAVDYIAPFDFIENLIDKSKVSAGTKKDYNNTLTHLKNFDEYRGKEISWKSVGYDYYSELVDYLINESLKASTIDKIVKNLKVFLNNASLTDNLEVNQDFTKTLSGKSLFAKINKDETEHIYLDEEEIKQITYAPIHDAKLSDIRDLFIIGCWTGLRISDLSRLQHTNIKNDKLYITTAKTAEHVVIPVTSELQYILDKHIEKFPAIPSDQHYNREIKKVCELAGINEVIYSEQKKGKMRFQEQTPKFKLVTSHTARRSFATNMFRRSVPAHKLMMLTGHRTEEAFLKYIKVSKEDNADDVARFLAGIS